MYVTFPRAAFHMHKISLSMLINSKAPKIICCETLLAELKWTLIRSLPLPPTIKPFHFAGNPVPFQWIAFLVAGITDIIGSPHYLHQIIFILSFIQIKFLLELKTKRALGFDICLWYEHGRHFQYDKWSATIPFSVGFRLCLGFGLFEVHSLILTKNDL